MLPLSPFPPSLSSLPHSLPIPQNTDMIFKRNVTVSGFLAPYIAGEYMGKFFEDVPRMLAEGKLKSTERIYEGMEAAPQAFVDMLKGGWDTAEGKVVVSLVGM